MSTIPILVGFAVGALCALGGILVGRLKEGTRQRAGLVAIIIATVCFLALVIMQLVYPANWPFWLVIALVVVPLVVAIQARWAGRRRFR
jgi:predicted MFS family arabinose efflux permease